jgi:hypothetical protein
MDAPLTGGELEADAAMGDQNIDGYYSRIMSHYQ